MSEVVKSITLKHVIGATIILLFFSSHMATLFVTVPKDNEGLVNHSLGILDAATIAIVSYYFGSSAGSKQKSEQMNEAFKTELKKP